MKKTITWTSPGDSKPALSRRAFQEFIFSWYDENGREFRWRKTQDPYEILVAEFLLQKTHVRKVPEVYEIFLSLWPRIDDLATADHERVEGVVGQLGFRYRAQRLVATARTVLDSYSGVIPRDYNELLCLPGVGPYIATAVSVFAFGERRVVVDTNVIKILEHFFGFRSSKPRPRTDKAVWEFADSLAPSSRVQDFNWGLLDYSAAEL
ncbi:MAG: hypothetical protein CME26_02735 [Gemmatimonadetes bacterium]|nr:hypothetical protein [Gemmatimonadota bacterium]|tara:strand:+ start:162 stop:785 length:624 start_codon:yes stop_codon:yes gene_type:complete